VSIQLGDEIRDEGVEVPAGERSTTGGVSDGHPFWPPASGVVQQLAERVDDHLRDLHKLLGARRHAIRLSCNGQQPFS
jgi:hypothetical protein